MGPKLSFGAQRDFHIYYFSRFSVSPRRRPRESGARGTASYHKLRNCLRTHTYTGTSTYTIVFGALRAVPLSTEAARASGAATQPREAHATYGMGMGMGMGMDMAVASGICASTTRGAA